MTEQNRTTPLPSEVRAVVLTVFLVFLAQMSLNPIIAPLAREVGLAEWQIGVVISVAALMVVLTSQIWGRRSQSLGRRPVLVAALTLAVVAMTAFALTSGIAIAFSLATPVVFIIFLIARGLLFGGSIAAILPTAQAHVADVTTTEPERVRGMAAIGSVQGMAMVAGAVVGGLLAGISITVSVAVVPLILLCALALVLRRVHAQPANELVKTPIRVKPTDPRVWPFLVSGFGMFTALGFVQVLTGFFVQDRFDFSSNSTGMVTGLTLLMAGVGMVLAQTLVVPKSRWSPVTLLRVGTAVAAIGFMGTLWADAPLPVFIAAIFTIALGLGTAMPGYTAGPTLAMGRDEQGGLAGLIGATNGLTFVVAPTLSTLLYAWNPLFPVLIGTSLMVAVWLFVMLHPRMRNLARSSAPTQMEPSSPQGSPATTDSSSSTPPL